MRTLREPAQDALDVEGDEDGRLVARSVAGDPAAFRVLFERHAPSVRRFLRDLGGDAAAADEATQETFVRAHARLATLRDEQRLRPWLLGVARRVLLEQHRRARPRTSPALREGTATSPQDELLLAEEVRVFRAALAALPAEQRGALLLRLDHGLRYDEIAAVTGRTLAQVRNDLHRGRQALRAELAAYFEERS